MRKQTISYKNNANPAKVPLFKKEGKDKKNATMLSIFFSLFNMIRSETSIDLSEWIKDPKHVGSVYIKPSANKQSCSEKLYCYFYYFCCCKYVAFI